MDVKEIVEEYLKANGYDGLYNYVGCGCALDDLDACGEISPCCEPGYKRICEISCPIDKKECDLYAEGCTWCISTNKPNDNTEATE